MISTCLNYLLVTLHLPHENPVSNPAVFLTNIDWESSLYSVLFSLTRVCLVKELGSGWVVIVGVQRIRALSQLKGTHTGQLGMADTSFPNRVGGFMLELRLLIPRVSFLPPLSHQGVFEIGGAEGAKRETRPQGLLC